MDAKSVCMLWVFVLVCSVSKSKARSLREERSASGLSVGRCKILLGTRTVYRSTIYSVRAKHISVAEEAKAIWNCTKYIGVAPDNDTEGLCHGPAREGRCITFHHEHEGRKRYLKRQRTTDGNLRARFLLGPQDSQPFYDILMIIKFNRQLQFETLACASQVNQSVTLVDFPGQNLGLVATHEGNREEAAEITLHYVDDSSEEKPSTLESPSR